MATWWAVIDKVPSFVKITPLNQSRDVSCFSESEIIPRVSLQKIFSRTYL